MKPRSQMTGSAPVFLAFLLTALVAAVAYGTFGLVLKLWLVLAVLLLWFFLLSTQTPGEAALLDREWIPPLSSGIWTLLIVLLVLSRFVGLTSFWGYPLYDEVFNAYYALHLLGHWTWHPFFFFSQLPPLFIWLLAGLFKLFGFSTLALWGLPAFFSVLCPLTFYAAARKFFSQSMAFLVFLVTAFGFWPVYLGRFSHPAGAMLWIEGLAFLAWGHYRGRAPGRRLIPALLLGACLGLGFYTYFAWAVVALGVTFGLAWESRGQVLRDRWALLGYAAAAFVVAGPLVGAALQGGYGSYIAKIYHNPGDPALYQEAGGVRQLLSFFSVFLWTSLKSYFTYGPFWGGLFNPLMGTAGLWGLASLVRWRRHQAVVGTFFLALAFFAPVPFTHIFNVLRLTPLIPLAALFVALGLHSILRDFKPGPGHLGWILAGFFLASASLDGVNLLLTRWAGNHLYPGQKDPAYVQAFEWMRQKAGTDGPGMLFLQFQPDTWDPSLWVMTYPFNALEGPPKAGPGPAWGALLVEDIYRPYLERIFPGIQWQAVGAGRRQVAGNVYFRFQVLAGIFPIGPGQRETLARWAQAEPILQNLVYRDHDTPKDVLSPEKAQRWLGAATEFQADPFLRTWFWERIAAEELALEAVPEALEATQNSEKGGLELGCLYQQEGLLLLRSGRPAQAKGALARAAKLNPLLKTMTRIEGP